MLKEILCRLLDHEYPKRNKYFPLPPLCVRCGNILNYKNMEEFNRAVRTINEQAKK